MKSHKFGKNSDGDPRSEPGMTRKLTKLTVVPDKINRHARPDRASKTKEL
mgnify:CR=1 FL=1